MEKIIETNNLSKKFGGVSALSNVNFQVEKNEIRCVIGPNGAGKSTLFKALFGLIKLDSGTCLLYTSPSPRDRQKSRMPSSA